MKSWYLQPFKMTPYQIEVVLNSFGRRKNGTRPKNINMRRVKFIVEKFLTTENKISQVELADEFKVSTETMRRHIVRVASACQRVCGKE